jgi:hypothetical protein
MAAKKEVNYTEEQTAEMKELYVGEPTAETVAALAVKYTKSARSVIAKLSREGIYVAKPRTTKSGDPIIRKDELVQLIEDCFEIEVPSLVKAGKADLQKLYDAIAVMGVKGEQK